MSKRLQLITFSIILLLLSWIWIKASYGDEEDIENGNGPTSVFSAPIRKPERERCKRPNPDDPRREILKGVYCPIRLKILDKDNPVRKFKGVLIRKHRATDGDLTFDVVPYEGYRYLINKSNIKYRNGGLHCEIVPYDRAKLGRIFGRMKLKSVVEVEGVWVEDTNHHNWRELHPVTTLRVVK